jgi:hypothetical protein
LTTAAQPSERLLTTLALLKVNQEEGFTYVDTYLPFLMHCLEEGGHEEVSSPKLQEELREEFEIELPHAVIKRLLREVERQGKAKAKNGVLVVDREAVRGSSLSAAIAEVERGQASLVEALVDFGNGEFKASWDEVLAERQLVRYVNSFSSRVLAAALTGEDLPRPDIKQDHDEYIVHRFAQAVSQRRPAEFDALVSLVKGRMLADAMYFVSESAEKPPSLEQVEIYLDGPPLLFVLGYAGEEMQAPYLELLRLLEAQGAVVRCFEHSVTEAREILDAAAAKAHTGTSSETYQGDVVSHLVRSGKTPVEIELLANRLENSLLKLGINPVETPARKPHLEPDEKGLSGRLQRAINYGNPLARDRDIDSLTAIYRIREGREFRDLEKCRAIFATHNLKLFRTSATFFRQRDRRTIPPCVVDMALATMLWLRDPAAQASLPEERIMARAYAALNPTDQLWSKYNEEIDRLRGTDEISEDDAVFLRYDRDAQEALMDETRGDPDAFVDGTVEQVIVRARDNLLAETRAERDAARAAAASATEAIRVSRQRVDRISRVAASAIATTLFAAVVAALVAGAVLGPVGPLSYELTSRAVQIACGAVVVVLGVVTIIHSPSLWEYRGMFAKWLKNQFARALSWGFRLEAK